jgi:hypothetical protein
LAHRTINGKDVTEMARTMVVRTITRGIVTVGALGALTFCLADPSVGIVIGAGAPGDVPTAVPSGDGWGGVAHSDGNGWGR